MAKDIPNILDVLSFPINSYVKVTNRRVRVNMDMAVTVQGKLPIEVYESKFEGVLTTGLNKIEYTIMYSLN